MLVAWLMQASKHHLHGYIHVPYQESNTYTEHEVRGHLISLHLFSECNVFHIGVTPSLPPPYERKSHFSDARIWELVAFKAKACISVSAHNMGISCQTAISELEQWSFLSCTYMYCHLHWKTEHLTQLPDPCHDQPLSMQHPPTSLLSVVVTSENSDIYHQKNIHK